MQRSLHIDHWQKLDGRIQSAHRSNIAWSIALHLRHQTRLTWFNFNAEDAETQRTAEWSLVNRYLCAPLRLCELCVFASSAFNSSDPARRFDCEWLWAMQRSLHIDRWQKLNRRIQSAHRPSIAMHLRHQTRLTWFDFNAENAEAQRTAEWSLLNRYLCAPLRLCELCV